MPLIAGKDYIKTVAASHKHHSHSSDLKPINSLAHFLEHVSRDRDARKLAILLSINLICTVLELVYGFLSNSIGLISDAAHMLFDSTALAVGIYASYKATLPPNHKFSYGYARFQTLAGFVNGIFLIFIAFYIFIESLERIYDPPVIYSEKMIVVAIIGLVVNVVGVTFFHEHAHFHGIDDEHSSCSHGHNHKHIDNEEGHKHSHSNCSHSHKHIDNENGHGHNHSHSHSHTHSHETVHQHQPESLPESHSTIDSPRANAKYHQVVDSHQYLDQQIHSHESHHTHSHDHKCDSHNHCDSTHSHQHHEHDHHDHDHSHDKHSHSHSHSHDSQHTSNENLYGVFLHILADLLGSVGVIASSILIMMFDWYIADAICSAVTSLLILLSIVPLLKSSTLIFLQTYPSRHEKGFHLALSEISHHPAVIECKDPHLWAFTHDKLVCSLILVLKHNTSDITKVLDFAKDKLTAIKGIKDITIDYQLEHM